MPEKELIEIVGRNNVLCKPAVLEQYSSDLSFVPKMRPRCIVKPGNLQDVQKIVRWAKQTLTPLVPVSSGPPHFRGDTVPGIGGAVIVDLSSMKKIIRTDRINRVTMFEPGVTFEELIPAVAREGLRLNLPLLPRKSKSVTGSLLEREPVVMPKYHWDISDPLSCVEVTFGTGDMFRTGAAAGPGTIEEQWAAGGAQKEAAGPSSASWYRVIQGSQGTMGIVTWASARCELIPSIEEPFFIGSTLLEKIMEMVHWLIRLRLANECLVLNNTNLASVMAQRWPGDYHKLRDTLPPWVLFFNLAGYEYLPEEKVSGQVKDTMDIAQRIGLKAVKALGDVSAFDFLAAVHHSSREPYWKLRYKGACNDIFFLSIYGKLLGLINNMYAEADKIGFPTSDIGVYLQPIVQGVNCHCEFNLFYDSGNSVESARIKDLTASAIPALITNGAFFSRPYGENARMIMNRDNTSADALRKVKSILDPANVMNPGKLCF
jgi:FAD binding domain/FAD linked oxidases, C-terminal domain